MCIYIYIYIYIYTCMYISEHNQNAQSYTKYMKIIAKSKVFH